MFPETRCNFFIKNPFYYQQVQHGRYAVRNFVALMAFSLLLGGAYQPCLLASTERITVQISDRSNIPIAGLVVMLNNTNTEQNTQTLAANAVMDQINREFIPHILVIQQGTRVSFPNSDSVQHHVYSFSPAKTFELKLYSALEAEPLLFDNPGIVELGCNIHDWMLGYIYVTNTPYFGQTDKNGVVTLIVPEGNYTLSLWHPRLSEQDIEQQMSISTTTENTLYLQLRAPLLPSLTDYNSGHGFSDYD